MLRSGGGRTEDTVRARAQKPTRNRDVGEGGFGLTKFSKTQWPTGRARRGPK
jgi:hypothetical protein